MSNIKSRPTNPEPQSEILKPKIYSPEYKHNLIDLDETPPNSIVVNIGGYPVVGDWYNSRIGMDQEADGFNIGQTTPHQAYRLLKNVRIKLNSPFDYNVSTTTIITEFSTVGKVYIPGFVPIEGDVFLMDLGNGRLGRFEVHNPRPLSLYQDRAFEFELRLMSMATVDVVAALDKKVVETLFYIEEFILNGQNPLITPESHQQRLLLKRHYESISKSYIAENYSHQHSTLLVPAQVQATYDPYVVSFILDLFEHDIHPLVRKIRDLNVDGKQTRNYVDIYTVLLNGEVDALSMCFKEASAISAKEWSSNYSTASIRLSLIPMIIYPVTPNHGADRYYNHTETGDVDGTPIVWGDAITDVIDSGLAVDAVTGKGYVFPSEFYDQTQEGMAKLSKLTMDYLEAKPIDVPDLLELAVKCRLWDAVPKFYYVPILVLLIKAAIKGI